MATDGGSHTIDCKETHMNPFEIVVAGKASEETKGTKMFRTDPGFGNKKLQTTP